MAALQAQAKTWAENARAAGAQEELRLEVQANNSAGADGARLERIADDVADAENATSGLKVAATALDAQVTRLTQKSAARIKAQQEADDAARERSSEELGALEDELKP